MASTAVTFRLASAQAAAKPFLAWTRLRRGLTGRPLSQAFGLATVRAYQRRASELHRWPAYSSTRLMNFQQFTVEFDRQAGTLVHKGYPKAAGLKAKDFLQHIEPLRKRIGGLAALGNEAGAGRIPFVVVVKSDLVASEKAMPLVNVSGAKGFVGLFPVQAGSFEPIEGVRIPKGMAYLLVDIDTGQGTLNVTPDDALKIIRKARRSPLTIDEGIALVTHYPEILKKRNCFSMLASRRGDRRVTALWISRGQPRLGWCWAGNPHSWLGSASCGSRVGR